MAESRGAVSASASQKRHWFDQILYRPGFGQAGEIPTSRCDSSFTCGPLGPCLQSLSTWATFSLIRSLCSWRFPPGQAQQFAKVIKTEEKGSDVNLATHLLHDAHMGRFDVAVVVCKRFGSSGADQDRAP